MTPVLASQNIAAIGTFLTLTSLLGTFFYVQLSTWLRDLIVLKAKFDLNADGNLPDETKAVREVRYALPGVYNTLPILVAAAITGFIAFAAWNAFAILQPFRGQDQIADRLAAALCVFLTIYVVLIIYLLIRGYVIGAEISRRLPK
jgi:hypothetical protein